MKRISIFWTLFVLIGIAISAVNVSRLVRLRSEADGSCKTCNVIVIAIDSLRADELPCYGYGRNTAPNICAFAKQSAMFTQAYSNSSWTMPSEFSVFTGLYPGVHQVRRTNVDSLNLSVMTMPQFFQKNGYRTVYVGATDHIHMPLNKGIGRGFDRIIQNGSDLDGLSEGIKEFKRNLTQKKPTFLFLHTYAIHTPYLPGNGQLRFTAHEYPEIALSVDDFFRFYPDFPDFILQYLKTDIDRSNKEDYADPEITHDRRIYEKMLQSKTTSEFIDLFHTLSTWRKQDILGYQWLKEINKQDPKLTAYIRALYDERIFELDSHLNQLLSVLSDPEIKQHSVVVLYSDHGDEFMEHGNLEHAYNLYASTTHVPLIISAPAVKHQVIQDLTEGVDVFPTIAGLVGLRMPAKVNGQDLSGTLLGKQIIKKQFTLSELGKASQFRAIRTPQWTYIYDSVYPESSELYDRIGDPNETHDIALQHKPVTDSLTRTILRTVSALPAYSNLELPK